ncbi:MAG: DUF642 domain-containing protein [Pseudomonadota bacterium]
MTGDGSLETVATLPFDMSVAMPSTVYKAGHALIMSNDGGLWSVDFNADVPTFELMATLPEVRRDANFTVLADGRVAISGGTNDGRKTGAEYTTTIWDPSDNSLTNTEDEATFRIYHSSTVLLRDGTILSSGGTTDGAQYSGQVYRPDYLYDDNGQPAERPEITDAPLNANAGQTIVVTVDDATNISKITLVSGQASTHSNQMSGGFFEVGFTVLNATQIEFTIPKMDAGMSPGNWMLFAWDSAGTPSMAPIMRVNPELPTDTDDANLLLNGGFDVGGADALGWTQDGDAGRAAPIATDGDTALVLESGAATQTVATKAGQVYKIAFDLALVGLHEDELMRVEALDGSTALLNQTVSVGADGSKTQRVEMTFVATGEETTLKLSNYEGNAVSVDNVSLSTNLIENGSFEEGGYGPGASVPDWLSLGRGGRNDNTSFSSDGEGYFALGGWSSGYYGDLVQQIATVVGQTYSVSLNARQSNGREGNKLTVEAFSGDDVNLSKTVDMATGNRSYETYTFTFTATQAQTTLRINNLASEGQTTWDSVSIDKVMISGSPNLITNGSFDDGVIGLGLDVPGWETSGAGGRSESATRATDGTGYYAIGGWSDVNNGVIEQTVETEAGKTYTLGFSAGGGWGSLGDGRILTAEALAGTAVDGTTTVEVASRQKDSHFLTFTASSDSTTIRFSDATDAPGSYDIDLDQIVLVETASVDSAVLINGTFAGTDSWTFEADARIADLAASDDEYMIIRNGDGTIHQTIATRPGEVYTLTFDIDEIGFSEYDTVLQVEALNNTVADMSELVTANDGRTVSLTFTATGLNTTIRFSDASQGGFYGRDLKIDKVSLEACDTAAGFVQGGDGNDLLRAPTATLLGGAGDDRLHLQNYGRGPEAYGGAGDDYMWGRNGWQAYYGEGGNDTLTGGGEYGTAEHDTLDGGDGDDLIIGGTDASTNRDWGDLLIGGAGNDTIESGVTSDTIDGGIGDDVMSGAGGSDLFIFRDDFGVDQVTGGEALGATTAENDVLDLSAVTDGTRTIFSADEGGTLTSGPNSITFSEIETFLLGDGADFFSAWGRTASVNVSGGAGNDDIRGSHRDDTINGGDGDDVIRNGNGQDLVHAGAGDDTVYTSYNNNRPDTVYGEAGNDRLVGVNGEQHLYGGEGNDTLSGGSEFSTPDVDILDGGAGDDYLVSGMNRKPANDWWARRGDDMRGGTGDDTLKGGAANDRIDGGDGIDLLLLTGAFADYVITQTGGTFTFADQRDGLNDGIDAITGIEVFRFGDEEVAMATLMEWIA